MAPEDGLSRTPDVLKPSSFIFMQGKLRRAIKSNFSALFPLNNVLPSFRRCLWLCASLPCREKQAEQHQHTNQCIISHTTELPLARRFHSGPPVETAPVMKQQRAARFQNREEEGALSLLLPRRVDN